MSIGAILVMGIYGGAILALLDTVLEFRSKTKEKDNGRQD